MADKECAYVDEKTGDHCPRTIQSGLFCPVHAPANEEMVGYITVMKKLVFKVPPSKRDESVDPGARKSERDPGEEEKR